jgi:hypothetical protein
MRRLSIDLLNDSGAHPGYPECSQPALVFHGIQDNIVPIAASEQWACGKANVRVVALASGHELLDVLEEIWEGSREFLTAGSVTLEG